MVESFLRIALIAVLLLWSYDIIEPFTVPLIWGAIIGIAAFPLVKWLEGKIGGKRGLAASLVSLFFILLLVIPTWQVTDALVGSLKNLGAAVEDGTLQVPPPPARVAELPMIGERLYTEWSEANTDLESLLQDAGPQIKELTTALFKRIGSSLGSVLMFVVSILIAGGFMAYAENCGRMAHAFFVRVGGLSPGGEWAPLTVATVRSVLKGVIGVAVIQAVLVGIGFVVMGIPGAPVWTALVLFLAIAQLPALLVVLPVIVYAFSAYDTTPAIIFTVWSLLAGASDNILKPILMGRGVDIPMPVILIGAIGGMIAAGIIGLFAGAVILSIWYKLFTLWLEQQPA
jgi:predicted PurR-regulated permease PerM